ncbi:hypothetical protein HAL07_05350 [Helicobacter ailurogastricus]|uniref:Uncharacterized protein n=1 Tax=Helicobacter ailurogastricus TaxID=1578720 RepID=A0A0K2Y3J5_9HELI|nr:hypothetical protein HAL07_05350 [Helicobacter ailurogastricus]
MWFACTAFFVYFSTLLLGLMGVDKVWVSCVRLWFLSLISLGALC